MTEPDPPPALAPPPAGLLRRRAPAAVAAVAAVALLATVVVLAVRRDDVGGAPVARPADVLVAAPQLPVDLPPVGGTGPKVFAHYVPWMPVSLDDRPPADDYYAREYLTPGGEDGKHEAYGGYLRDRPLPRSPRGGDWRLADLQSEVRQAASVGIDGFVVDVVQVGDPGGRLWDATRLLLQAAAVVPGFTVMLMPDMTGSPGSLSPTELAGWVAELGRSPSAYRLGDGRLVVSPFTAERHDVEWWRAFLAAMQDDHDTRVALLPLFQDERQHRDAFAPISWGMSNWGARSPARNDPTGRGPDDPVGRVRQVHALGKVWMQPVSAQDERPAQGVFDEAQNTTNLRDSWQVAIDSGAEIVQLATWNDYAEGTQLAPSQGSGWSWLDLSAYWLVRYRTGRPPPVVRDAVYLTHRTQPWRARPRGGQDELMQLRADSSPARDTVEALTFLTAPGTVEVTVGGQSTRCDVPAGVGTCTAPLRAGRVAAVVTRGGAEVARVQSTHVVTTRPSVQDLHYQASGSLRRAPDDAG